MKMTDSCFRRNDIKGRGNDKPKGSILIWSVTMGFVLTSVFFFFAMRTRLNAEVQRQTAATQNARGYLDSYAGYLQHQYPTAPYPGSVSFDGMTGTFTDQVDSLSGTVDSGATNIFPGISTSDIYVCWNKTGDPVGTIEINGNANPGTTPGLGATGAVCDGFGNYKKITHSFSVVAPYTGDDIELKSLSSPIAYKILPVTGQLTDSTAHLNLSMTLDYGKKVSVEK